MTLKNKAKAITLKHVKSGTRPFLCLFISALMILSSFALALTGLSVYAAAKAPSDAAAAVTISEAADGSYEAVISLQNCLDFTEGSLTVEYDTAALELVPRNTEGGFVLWEILDDAKAFSDVGNTFSATADTKDSGKLTLSFSFIESLDAESWGVDVDMTDVKLFGMTFNSLGASDTELTVTGSLSFFDGSRLTVNESAYIKGSGAPEETTTEAPEETTTEAPEETTTEAPEETTTEAPEETTTEAPEETTTDAPEETTTEAPEEIATESPEEITTEAPEETTQHTHLYRQFVILAPDCVNAGECEFICDCGETCRCILPATGHNDNNGDGSCDSCGNKEDEKPEEKESFLDKIKAFFERLAEFFRNLFTKA